MATRRQFTFGSLVLALTGSRAAQAGIPTAAPKFDVAFTAKAVRKQRVVEVSLVAELHAEAAMEAVVERGSMPGPWLQASLLADAGEPVELSLIYEGNKREMFMSRVGPVPRWAPMAVGKPMSFGPYRFSVPRGAEGSRVQLVGGMELEEGLAELAMTVSLDAQDGPKA